MVLLNVGQNYRVVGGSDRYLLSLESLLSKCGVDVIPFSTVHEDNNPSQWSSYFPRRVNFDNPRVMDLINYVYSREAANKIHSLLRANRVDVAHLHIYYGQLSGAIIPPLKAAGIPVVQTLHEYKLICPTYSLYRNGRICEACGGGSFYKALLNRCNRGSVARSALSVVESYTTKFVTGKNGIDHYIAVSDFLRSKMIEHGVPAEKITTVHNFIDSTKINPTYGKGDYFLYFGRIERIKGIFTLIDVFKDLNGIELVIVGGGTESEIVKAMAECSPYGNISYLGFRQGDELSKLIAGARAVIAPSEWYETFGLTLIEAFAHGRPVISSRIGGMSEVVSDGEDGLLVNPGDRDDIRRAVLKLWSDPGAAAEMGRLGRTKVERDFGPDAHLKQIRNVYARVGVTLP